MNKNIIQRVILGGVVYQDGKVLILQRHKDEDVYPEMWELPSGKKELLEPYDKSLLREIKEETGLNVEIVAPISVFDYTIEKADEIRDSTQINFLVKPINNGKIKLSNEHQSFAWVNEGDIDSYNLTEGTKKVVEKAFKLVSGRKN